MYNFIELRKIFVNRLPFAVEDGPHYSNCNKAKPNLPAKTHPTLLLRCFGLGRGRILRRLTRNRACLGDVIQSLDAFEMLLSTQRCCATD